MTHHTQPGMTDSLHVCACVLLALVTHCHAALSGVDKKETVDSSTGTSMGWDLIIAIICFALGGILIIIGFLRITWYACTARKYQKQKNQNQYYSDNVNAFASMNTDPWLKDNPLDSNRRGQVGLHDRDSLHDLDIDKFNGFRNSMVYGDELSLTESQRQGSPRSMPESDMEQAYHSLPKHGISHGKEIRIDSETLQRNAKYVEPDTNIIVAKKHAPPPEVPPLALHRLPEEPTPDYHNNNANPANNDNSQRSVVDTTDAFAALDNATAGENTGRSYAENSSRGDKDRGEENHGFERAESMVSSGGVSGKYLLDTGEPLAGNREVEYRYESTSTHM